MVITTINSQFDVYQVLVDGGSSCDIIYTELFEKMNLKKENLWLYKGSDLRTFKDIKTRALGKEKDIRNVENLPRELR